MYLDFYEPCSKVDVAVLQKNRYVTNITQLLLSGEGFVTRAMRNAGAEEKYITGDGSDYEKFRELCRAYPLFEGNAAQFVCDFVLRRFFGCDTALSAENCDEIWMKTADCLVGKPLTAAELLRGLNVGGIGVMTDISAELSPFGSLDTAATPVLCPDSVLSVDKRGYKKRFSLLETAFGEKITCISDFDAALSTLTERFTEKGCSLAVVSGLSREDFGKSDHYHAQQALENAIRSDGNVSAEESRDFRRYAIGKFLEACREKKLDVLLEFCAPALEILPDIKAEATVERRIWLNFSEKELPLVKEGFIDLGADLEQQLFAYSRRYAIGNLPPFFVGTANLAELCLHELYLSELKRFSERSDGVRNL